MVTAPAGLHGRVTYNGVAALGIELELRFWNGVERSTCDSASTTVDGSYDFTDVSSLGSDQAYANAKVKVRTPWAIAALLGVVGAASFGAA